jgi:hypothetical protein
MASTDVSPQYLPGTASATTLVRVGLPHEAVVRALVSELDLTAAEAEAAWRAARRDELADIRRATQRLSRHSAARFSR